MAQIVMGQDETDLAEAALTLLDICRRCVAKDPEAGPSVTQESYLQTTIALAVQAVFMADMMVGRRDENMVSAVTADHVNAKYRGRGQGNAYCVAAIKGVGVNGKSAPLGQTVALMQIQDGMVAQLARSGGRG